MPAPLILAFDAACAACSVAVARVGASGGVETLASESRALERGHAAVLAPMIEAALAAAGVAPAALSLVAVTSGPGSFTGVRIALATARGLALALDIPVAAISTTSVVLAAASQADRARAAADRATLVAAIDTRREDFYVALADTACDAGAPFVGDARAVAARLAGRPAVILGDGAPALAARLAATGVDARVGDGPAIPDVVVLAALAGRDDPASWRARNAADGMPRPLYLRAAEATPSPPRAAGGA